MSSLEVVSLTKCYGANKALSDFSFSADPGRITTVIGPDGAGKTTLFRACCGLISIDSGTVLINGFDIRTEADRIKLDLGYMPQSFSLYNDLTVEENLRFYAGIYGISKHDFDGKLAEFYGFSGLERFRQRRAGALSGGMKQKLALGCAIIHDPKIFILDEPTAGVDPLSRRQFWDILRKLKGQGSTIIVSTPYMDEVFQSDKAIFIYQGKKLAEGTPQELTGIFKGKIYEVSVSPTTGMIRNLAALSGLAVHRFGSAIHLSLGENDHIERYFDDLDKFGIDKSNIKEIEPGLEDIFVNLMSTIDYDRSKS